MLNQCLSGKQKETVQKMKQISSPGGGVTIEIPEFDLDRAKEREEYVYLIEIDLIHDVQRRGKTPWEAFKEYMTCGTIMECEFNFAAVGTLEDEGSNQIPLDILFASIIDPSFITSLFEGIPADKFTTIQGPAHPQALLKDLAAPAPAAPEPAAPTPAPAAPAPAPTRSATVAAAPAAAKAESAAALKLAQAAVDPDAGSAKTVEDTLRVNINLLENLMNLAGELVLSRNQLQNAILSGDSQMLHVSGQRINLVTSELQETIMLTRMQPIGNILNKFPRVVRDLARERNKEVELEISGKDVEIDKSLIEGLSEPLVHMVRNAVDHGIEDRATRIDQGKDPVGKIIVRAYHATGEVVVEICDDGKGIDPQKVSQTALKRGLATEEQIRYMSDKEKTALIFLAGLSTAETVTDISGRGVGMDVVKTNLNQLGGKIDIESKPGFGTTFRITLPLTLAIIPSLLISVNKYQFAIPQLNISEMIHVAAGQVKKRIEVIGDAEVLILREKLIPILYLADLLDIERIYTDPDTGEEVSERRQKIADRRSKHSPFSSGKETKRGDSDAALAAEKNRRNMADRRYHADSDLDIVIITIGTLEYGLVVDQMHDIHEIVVRPLGKHLKGCREYSGATVLGDGRVALILDTSGLALKARLKSVSGTSRAREIEEQKNTQQNLLSMLLFYNAPGEACAIPLSYVERIEHIDLSQIETVGSRRTMQYRGSSLPLVKLNDMAQVGDLAADAEMVVLVINVQNHVVGLLAAQPVDAIEISTAVDNLSHRQKGIAGSCIIEGRTTLLVDIDELVEPILPAKSSETPKPARSGPAETTILLVEDSGFFRSQVGKYLEAEGYQVLSAEDGQAGLDLLRLNAERVRLVVTDIEMPVMNGLEMTRRIKADPALAHLAVIALTTLADEADMAAGKAAGVTAYEIKLDKDKLLQTVRQLLLSSLT